MRYGPRYKSRLSVRPATFRSAPNGQVNPYVRTQPGVDYDFTKNRYWVNKKTVSSLDDIPGWTASRTGTRYSDKEDGTLIPFTEENLLTYSEDFSNAAWNKSGSSISADASTAPDGTTTADALIEDTGTSEHIVYDGVTVTNATAYTFSVYAKPNGRTLINLILAGVGSATFDIDAGSVTNTALGSASISDAGNGWYRCAITFTTATTSYNAQVRLVSTGTTVSYTGDGTSGVYLWGAQIRKVTTQDTYVATTSSAITTQLPRRTDKGLAVDAGATNLVRQSDSFSTPDWGAKSAGLEYRTDPAGGQLAIWNPTTAVSNASFATSGYSVSFTASDVVTYSLHIKEDTATEMSFAIAFDSPFAWVALVNATWTAGVPVLSITAGAGTTNVEALAGGWYRVAVTVTIVSTGNHSLYVYPAMTSGPAGVDGLATVVWGAQLETGSVATPYIPTTSASASAGADTASVDLGLVTNLLTYSEEFDNAAWAKLNTTYADGALRSNTGTATVKRFGRAATPGADPFTIYWDVKADGVDYVQILQSVDGQGFCNFDLTDGSVGTSGTKATGSVTALGDGYYRCIVTFTGFATTNQTFYLYLVDSSSASYGTVSSAADGDGVFIARAQLQTGATAQDYIPTTSTTASRWTNVGNLDPSQGFWVLVDAEYRDGAAVSSGGQIVLQLYGAAGERLQVYNLSANIGAVYSETAAGDTGLVAGKTDTGLPFKTALSLATDDLQVSVNGAAVGSDSAVDLPTLTTLSVGSANGSAPCRGYIYRIAIGEGTLTDAQLQAMST